MGRQNMPYQNPTKASEVLMNALVLWEDGKKWVSGTIGTPEGGMCFYGGIHYGAGMERYKSFGTERHEAYRKAEAFILDELQARNFNESIINFNDDATRNAAHMRQLGIKGGGIDRKDRFAAVKDIACGALKRAVAAEEKEEARVKA